MPRSVDDDVMGQFQDLIGKMRAKRLSSMLPQRTDPKLNDEAEAPGDADGDQEALEAMLNDGNDAEPDNDPDDQRA